MLDWLLSIAGVIVAVGAAAAMLRKAVRWMLTTVRKAVRLIDDLTGEPAHGGRPARPGLMERVASIERRLDVLEELRANGGVSIKDKVNAIAEATGAD